MARIAGVDLPNKKRIEIALTYIYGIGTSSARKVIAETKINPSTTVGELTDAQITAIRNCLENSFKIEGDLRKEINMSIKRLMSINCYRGIRHKKHLPVRGQRTHTNARTRKGPRKGMIKKKK